MIELVLWFPPVILVVFCRQAEEARPQEEVRVAVQLRRLRGDGGGGERRGRHAV